MGELAEFISSHPWLIAGLVVSWLAVMTYELRLKAQGLTHVAVADAVRLINKGALVIDVREPDAYAAGHIVNSRNIPLKEIAAGGDVVKKQKNKVLLTVCDRGQSSGKAANALRKAGYESVFSLKGGLAGWRAENLPLVK